MKSEELYQYEVSSGLTEVRVSQGAQMREKPRVWLTVTLVLANQHSGASWQFFQGATPFQEIPEHYKFIIKINNYHTLTIARLSVKPLNENLKHI